MHYLFLVAAITIFGSSAPATPAPSPDPVAQARVYNGQIQIAQQQLAKLALKAPHGLPFVDKFPAVYPFGETMQADFYVPPQGTQHVLLHIIPVMGYGWETPITINGENVDESLGGDFSWYFRVYDHRGQHHLAFKIYEYTLDASGKISTILSDVYYKVIYFK